MTQFRDRGVVLRTIRLGEADRIVTLMTEHHGKVRAVAKGVRRTTSKFGSRLEPLSHVALLGWQGRGDLDTINQVEVIDTFRPVREDLDRMSAGLSMLEVVDQVGQERHANPRLYEMAVRAIAALSERNSPMVVPAFFLKVLALEGSAPMLDGCVSCGQDDDAELVAFDIVEGGVLCRACRRGRPLSPEGLALLRRTLGADCPACWPGPGRRPPTRWRPWPPRPWRPTSTGGSGRSGPARSPERVPVSGAVAAVTAERPFGVYVHVPFCRHRCDYCAFATYTDRDHLMAAYAAACTTELARAVEREGMPPASSVFFGGGTPSRLPADLLVEVLGAVPRRPGAEVTVECNPEDVTAARLATYRGAGVTRISLGVQSTVGHVLEGLGRRHGPGHVAEAAALVAAAGFTSWNLDLMIGGAGSGTRTGNGAWTTCSDCPRPPPHLSAYALTVEPGTPLALVPDRHPDDDVQAARYETADRVLEAAGYRWEEISNWARPGHECRHNRLYWDQGDYRGIGSASHSHAAGRRWWNVRTPDRYVALVEADGTTVAGEEVLDPSRRAFEALALALRTAAGVPLDALPDHPDLEGLVDRSPGRAVLTVRGRLLANAVTGYLAEAEPVRDRHEGPTGTIPRLCPSRKHPQTPCPSSPS